MLDRVTITGADDAVSLADMIAITKDYPFVEWGILVSETNTIEGGGKPRYPSTSWLRDLVRTQYEGDFEFNALSLHVCGKWTRRLLVGEILVPQWLWTWFNRMQLNFRPNHTKCNGPLFAKAIHEMRVIGGEEFDFIFQLVGGESARGNAHMETAMDEEVNGCYGLFDGSGGTGKLPDRWPEPIYTDMMPGEDGEGVEVWSYHGYAGGLGPDNLGRELPRILEAAAGTKHTQEGMIWIDMETGVRTNDDRLDLRKVCRALEIAGRFITGS